VRFFPEAAVSLLYQDQGQAHNEDLSRSLHSFLGYCMRYRSRYIVLSLRSHASQVVLHSASVLVDQQPVRYTGAVGHRILLRRRPCPCLSATASSR
jgi:hypothetical protein